MTLLSTKMSVCAADISLISDTVLSTEGYFVISWASVSDPDSPVILQQSPSENFGVTVTREFNVPPNSSITITGLQDGQYYFRAKAQDESAFSNVLMVEVAHHSLLRALSFFAIGLILFLILLVTIISGNRTMMVKDALTGREDGNAS